MNCERIDHTLFMRSILVVSTVQPHHQLEQGFKLIVCVRVCVFACAFAWCVCARWVAVRIFVSTVRPPRTYRCCTCRSRFSPIVRVNGYRPQIGAGACIKQPSCQNKRRRNCYGNGPFSQTRNSNYVEAVNNRMCPPNASRTCKQGGSA